jgi:lipopolysaccharide heptosyltransferase II
MKRDARWTSAKNILCIRLDSLGDVLMTTPAMRAIKEGLPGSHLTLMTSPAGATAGELIPEVDDVIVYKAPWMKPSPAESGSAYDLEMIARLKAARFDAAVIFTVYSQSPLPAALLAYLAGIPLRLAHCRENPYHLLSDWVKESEPEQLVRHEVRRHLDLAAAVGFTAPNESLSLRVPPESCLEVEALLTDAGLERSRPWFVLHPGVSAPSRQYPPENYTRVARLLALEYGWQIVITGSAKERILAQQIQDAVGLPTVNLAGKLSLAQLAALIQLAPLLVANNTGPVHIAAALGIPVVVLYALTNPQHTPWQVPARVLNHDVPCKFCYKSICPQGHHHCLTLVNPETVADAALELYALHVRP